MSNENPLLVERRGPILILTMNRPDRLNALNRPMQQAFEDQFRAADADPSIRVIVITGAGRAFREHRGGSRADACADRRCDSVAGRNAASDDRRRDL